MIKIKTVLCALAVSSLVLTGFTAQAKTVNFLDDPDVISFPGYPQGTPWGNVDEYGSPNIDSMSVTWDENSGILQRVVLNLRTENTIRFDSLFIDTGYNNRDTNWEDWDYLVHTKSTKVSDGIDQGSKDNIQGDIPTKNGLYAVDADFTAATGYTKVKSGGRNGHPDGIDADYLAILDTTVIGRYFNKKITYDFSTLGNNSISVKNGFSIGYSPWCANDVILATYKGADPVPEPATMLLFGSGLAGLAGMTRLRRAKI